LPLRITISKENYLKAIAEAESEGETVKAVTLVRWLGVSAPAVDSVPLPGSLTGTCTSGLETAMRPSAP